MHWRSTKQLNDRGDLLISLHKGLQGAIDSAYLELEYGTMPQAVA